MGKLRILLADDHEVVRTGVKTVLNSAPDLEVVAEASNGAEAVELVGLQLFAERRETICIAGHGFPLRPLKQSNKSAEAVPALANFGYRGSG